MQAYRVRFEDGHSFLVNITIEGLGGSRAELATAIVYRITRGELEREPLRRGNGSVFEFTGMGEVAALHLACSVLQVLHGRMQSVRLEHGEPWT